MALSGVSCLPHLRNQNGPALSHLIKDWRKEKGKGHGKALVLSGQNILLMTHPPASERPQHQSVYILAVQSFLSCPTHPVTTKKTH